MTGDAPRWAPITSLTLCAVGLAVSAYLTYEHYSAATTLACPNTGSINCVKVTTSSYSSFLGIPVALLGLLFFAALTPLCIPAAWRSRHLWVARARLAAVAGGVLFVLYLVWAELFRIDAICLWCTAVHAVTVALFAVVVMAAALRPVPAH
ncbi:MAG: vitamin K epoxide reductase family protein [Actinomycetes bacterium]